MDYKYYLFVQYTASVSLEYMPPRLTLPCAGGGGQMLARGQCRAHVWGDGNNTVFIVESSICNRERAFRTRTHERITGLLQPLAYVHIARGGAPIETCY